MKIIAVNKLNGAAYFLDEKGDYKYITFPYTANFIKQSNKEEVSYALNYYDFDSIDKSVENLKKLISVIKKIHVDASASHPYNESLKEIELNEIISFADKKHLLQLCDEVEHSLISNERFTDALKIVDLIFSKAEHEDIKDVLHRLNTLKQLINKKRYANFRPYMFLFEEVVAELGEDALFKIYNRAFISRGLLCIQN